MPSELNPKATGIISNPRLADLLLSQQVVKFSTPAPPTGYKEPITYEISQLISHEFSFQANFYPFFPCKGKVPIGLDGKNLAGWPSHKGFTLSECLAVKAATGIGVRTSLKLLALDFDGESAIQFACDIGLNPFKYETWHIHRKKEFGRFKLLFQPAKYQIAELQGGEFQAKHKTKDAVLDEDGKVIAKGEALEVFLTNQRQVVVFGEHPDNDSYLWHDLGPGLLTWPPKEVWEWVKSMEPKALEKTPTSTRRSPHRPGQTNRLNPCPICGRNSRSGNDLWCEKTHDGIIFCMPGSTFNAEQKHGPLRVGAIVDGYALVKRTPMGGGDCLTFMVHKPTRRPRRPSRPKRRLSDV